MLHRLAFFLRPRVSLSVLFFGLGTAAIGSIVSCGSRTGLFTDIDSLALPDGSVPDGSDDGKVPCIPGRFTFELARANLMFVIDRSGSMKFSLDGRDNVPRSQWRWTILHNALQATIVPFDQQMAMGAKFFPEPLTEEDLFSSERSCQVDQGTGILPARGNAKQILDVFTSTDEPRGGTPTSEGLRTAAQALVGTRAVSRTIVLATDGAPNCNGNLDATRCVCTNVRVSCSANPDRGRYSCLDDVRTINTVRDIAEKQKIPVYVIGIGSTENPAFLRVLDDMAVAGGRPRASEPRHYNVQSPQQLQDALGLIQGSVAKCTYLTPSAPVNPDDITVEINGAEVSRDPTRTTGWDWVDQAYGELAFFGAACDLAGAGNAAVTGVVRCEKQR
jgi:hypothetical protein